MPTDRRRHATDMPVAVKLDMKCLYARHIRSITAYSQAEHDVYTGDVEARGVLHWNLDLVRATWHERGHIRVELQRDRPCLEWTSIHGANVEALLERPLHPARPDFVVQVELLGAARDVLANDAIERVGHVLALDS